MFDVVHLAMRRAVEKFGGNDKVFNGAGFGKKFGGNDKVFNGAGFGTELAKLANLANGVDGNLVEVILCGREDVEQLSGGSHYRLLEKQL